MNDFVILVQFTKIGTHEIRPSIVMSKNLSYKLNAFELNLEI